MAVTLQAERKRALEEVRAFLEGSGPLDIKLASRASADGFIRCALERFGHHAAGKVAKGLLWARLGKGAGSKSFGAGGLAEPPGIASHPSQAA